MVTKKKAPPKKKAVKKHASKKKAPVRARSKKKTAPKKKTVVVSKNARKKVQAKSPDAVSSISSKSSGCKLTPKQALFVKEYLVDLNATQAAIRSGYSEKTAQRMGSENLSKPLISDLIAEEKTKRLEKVGVDAEFVLVNLADMAKADPCDIIDRETGAFLSIHDWPQIWRRMLSAMEIKEIMGHDGDKQVKIGDLVKFKFPDRLRVFEVLGKHVDVQAFLKQIEVTENMGLAERMRRSRDRAQGKRGSSE